MGTEHLLLGVLRRPAATVDQLLERVGADGGGAVQRLEASLKQGPARAPSATLPYRPGAKKVLEGAVQEAKSLGQFPAGPQHLLLALLKEKRGPASKALMEAGISPEQIRGALARGQRDRPESKRAGKSPAGSPVPSHQTALSRPSARRLSLRLLLLLAIPASVLLQVQHAPPLAIFITACLGVLPLAGYMGEATEHLAAKTGPTLGGFLNASFGNAAELIIAVVALQAGLVELVKASITGSILGNLLLILGLSLLAGGTRQPVLRFNRTAAGMSAAMLALAVVGLCFPALFHALHPEEAYRAAELRLSEVVALILLVTYICSLLFSLRTHRNVFSSGDHALAGPVWGVGKAIAVLAAATVGIGIESEILVHATQEVTVTLGLSQTFLGLIVIPIIGNAAEHATAVMVARRGQMDLSLGIALGSSTQVALLVAPVLVFASLGLGQSMNLVFTPLEVAAVSLSTIVVAIITLDGESHWFEGVQLLAVYAMIAAASYFI